MTPAQALATATTTAAALLGLPGPARPDRAGLPAPTSSPSRATRSRHIDALFTGVRWVMKDGKVVVDKR